MVLEFVDGYLDGLSEINSIYEASKEALPQVLAVTQQFKASEWAIGDELLQQRVK